LASPGLVCLIETNAGEGRCARERHVHRRHVGDDAAEGVADLGLADQAERGDVVAGAAGADGLKPRPLAEGEGTCDEDVLRAAPGEVARELAKGALRLAGAGEDLALDDDLGRGGDVEIDCRARGDLERLAEEAADHSELADVGADRPTNPWSWR
jgi:hypothetical protein